jgi:hypothetical protein
MLPNPDHAPTSLPQGAIHNLIPLLVRCQLAPPERAIVLRLRRVLRTTVPETAVHKNCEPRLLENEIRFAKDCLMASPAFDAMPPEQSCQRQFRVLVAAPANPRHHL